jgi:hypothetical protein
MRSNLMSPDAATSVSFLSSSGTVTTHKTLTRAAAVPDVMSTRPVADTLRIGTTESTERVEFRVKIEDFDAGFKRIGALGERGACRSRVQDRSGFHG